MLPRATLSNVAVPQGRRPTQAFLKLLKKAEQRFLRARLRIGIICLQQLSEPRPEGSGPAEAFFSNLVLASQT